MDRDGQWTHVHLGLGGRGACIPRFFAASRRGNSTGFRRIILRPMGRRKRRSRFVKREALKPFFQATPTWTIGQLEHLLTRLQTYYNCHRLHGGIGWHTPTQRWFTQGDTPPTGLKKLVFLSRNPILHFEFC